MSDTEAEAKVKVTVDDKALQDFPKKTKATMAKAASEATKELKKLEKAAEESRKKMFDKLADAGKDLGSGIVKTLRTAALGVGAGAVAMVKHNMDSEKSFRKVAFAMTAGGKAGADWAAMQKKSFELTKRLGGSQEELAAGMAKVFAKSGDADYSVKAMESLATAGAASGESMDALGTIAGELNAKFGVTADQLDDAMAKVLEFGNKGGLSVEEIAGSFDAMGKSASRAGLKGADSFVKMMALSTKMGDAVGGENAALSQLSKILTKIGPAADAKMKGTLKAMGVQYSSTNALDTLGSLMKVTKGDEGKLTRAVGAQGATFLGTGLGAGGFEEAMAEASKSTLKGADVQKAAAAAAESNEKRIERAMATIAERFAAPDVMNAIERLTKALPGLADGVVSVVDMISKHPYLAGGAAAVGLGGGTASSAIGSIVGVAKAIGEYRKAQTALAAAQSAEVAATAGATAGLAGMAATMAVAVAAIAAWAVAVDQAVKLSKDVDTYKADEEAGIQEAIKASVRQGDQNVQYNGQQIAVTGKDKKGNYTYSRLESQMMAQEQKQASEQGYEIVPNANGTDLQKYEYSRQVAMPSFISQNAIAEKRKAGVGKLNEGGKSVRTLNEQLAYQDEVAAANAKLKKSGSSFQWSTGGTTPTTPGPSNPQKAALDANARALDGLPAKLAAQELRVRVTNPDDIGGTKPPTPSHLWPD